MNFIQRGSFFLACCLAINLNNGQCQSVAFADNGVYLTQTDYKRKVLAYPSQAVSDRLVELQKGKIKLIRGAEEIIFDFGTIYGYRARGTDFYAYGKKKPFHLYGYFQVLDSAPLYIYMRRSPHPRHIYLERPMFSLTADSKKIPLTVYHLQRHVPLERSTIRQIQWMKRNLPTLATRVNDKCLINALIRWDVVWRESPPPVEPIIPTPEINE